MKKQLSTLTKVLYGTGDFGYSTTNSLITAFFPYFITVIVGLDPGLAAIALWIGRSWDWVNDPIIGHLTDRTRSQLGRRRPWLLYGAIPFGLLFMTLWIKPAFINPTALVVFYACLYLIYEVSATVVYVPYFSLTPELTNDYDERTQLTSYRMLFNIIGGLFAYVVPLAVFGVMKPENSANSNLWILMGVVMGLLVAIPYLIVFFSVKEKAEFVPSEKPAFLPSIKLALKNKPFLFAAGIYLFTWLTIILLETNLLYYIKFVIMRPEWSELVMGTIFVTAIIALPFWNYISKTGNKRKAYIIGVAFWAVVMCLLILVKPETPLWVLLVMCVMAGIGLSAGQVLPWSIIPDAIEWDEYQTGERHEGMFYSLITFLGKFAFSIAVPASMAILKLTGFNSESPDLQPQSAINGIKYMIGPIPAVLLVTGILFAAFYPLSREKYVQVVHELEKRRKRNMLLNADQDQTQALV